MGWCSVTNAHIERARREPPDVKEERGTSIVLLLRHHSFAYADYPQIAKALQAKRRAPGAWAALGVFRPSNRDDIDMDEFFPEPPRWLSDDERRHGRTA